MDIKVGKGKNNDSFTWMVVNNADVYTAKLAFITRTTHKILLYQITKEVFDNVGIFAEDDYQSENLIRQYGRLLYEEDSENWGNCVKNVVDKNYKELCNWAFTSYDELILQHEQTETDKTLALYATHLWKSFVINNKNWVKNLKSYDEYSDYKIMHTWAGYSLLDVSGKCGILATVENLEEFIPMIFLILDGISISWKEICATTEE